MKIYLSRPVVVCGAGTNTTEFFETLTTGSQKGLRRVQCGKNENGGDQFFWAGQIADGVLKPTQDRYDSRFLQILDYVLTQLKEGDALKKAISLYGAKRIGVCLGQCDNGSERSFAGHRALWTNGSFPADYDLTAQGADYPATFAAKKSGVEGLALSFATACSSSATALIKARQLILSGVCDAVIAGGVDVASPTTLLGFNSLEAISAEKTNPFSKNRTGITLGEGAAFFVMSKDDVDGTEIVLSGAGESSDASHMTAPLADGTGAAQAMRSALRDAGVDATAIDYINLHGTGTKLNDSMEAKAVASVFANCFVPVSSTKSMTGHTLGAAGALELAACFCAIQKQRLPLHIWDGKVDDEFPRLNFVSDSQPQKKICRCMSNSFAFGGCNVSLIIEKE
ncbi:MAG: 3-oxoacyl-ACP synthase [Treponema sp.]|nr:3-oxoacyl-ACP synthase [Treponema sp.]